MTRNNPEYHLHVAIVDHINSAFIGAHNPNLKFWHVANQTRDATEAYFNKEMGVLPGVLDLQFGWPTSKAGVLEVKAPEGKLSSAQNRFISWAKAIGWHTGECRTVRGAHLVLCSWGLNAAHTSIQEPDYRSKQEKFKDAFEMYRP